MTCLTYTRGADRRRLRVPEAGLVVEDVWADDAWDWRRRYHFGDAARQWGFFTRRAAQLRKRGWTIEAPEAEEIVVRCMDCHRRKGVDGVFGPEILDDARRIAEGLTVSDGLCPTCCLSRYGIDPAELEEEE
jgi:hypothetical protein